MSKNLSILPLGSDHIALADQHLLRHVYQSGQYGVHWLPYDPATLTNPPSINPTSLTLDYDSVAWDRWWGVFTPDDKMIGHTYLRGAKFTWGLHRCELGMGLEYPHWQQGLGTQLLTIAIEHANSVKSLDWIDLHVLGGNQPAINLYAKHGFNEISRVPDFCRIDGTPTDDILMSLRVRG